MSESHTTQDHNKIKTWAEARGGSPAVVRGTGDDESEGILRIDFPGGAGEEQLKPISWEEFFGEFDKRNLTFLYKPTTLSEGESRFCKFIYSDGTKR